MTVEQIVSAIRALPPSERRRILSILTREAAGDVPADEAEAGGGVTLVERNGLLIARSGAKLPVEAFDHRPDREARADRIWGGS